MLPEPTILASSVSVAQTFASPLPVTDTRARAASSVLSSASPEPAILTSSVEAAADDPRAHGLVARERDGRVVAYASRRVPSVDFTVLF